MASVAGTAGGVPLASPAGVVTVVVAIIGIAVIYFVQDRKEQQRSVPRITAWHIGGFISAAAAMCVLVLRLDLVWFVVAALALLACSLGGWLLERKQGRSGS